MKPIFPLSILCAAVVSCETSSRYSVDAPPVPEVRNVVTPTEPKVEVPVIEEVIEERSSLEALPPSIIPTRTNNTNLPTGTGVINQNSILE